MNEQPNLTFNLRHTTRELSCEEAGHNLTDGTECRFLHTTFTGDATLTLAGPADLVRRAGAAALPLFAAVLGTVPDGPSTPIAADPTDPMVVQFCNWCPTPAAPSLRYHPDGLAHHREPAPDGAIHLSHDANSSAGPDCARCWRCGRDVELAGMPTQAGIEPCKPSHPDDR